MDQRDKDAISEGVWRHKREHALGDAKGCARQYTRSQGIYPRGRIILDAETPREHASNYLTWFDRAECYRLEHEKLQEDDHHRASRCVPWFTEFDRAKCEAGNVARMLSDFPAGKLY